MQHSTIAAIATAPGAGGIAIVRLSGPESYEVVAKVFRPANPAKKVADAKGYTAMFGAFVEGEEAFDEGVALFFRAPHSYTGEDVVELSCHGGSAVARRLVEACIAAGACCSRRVHPPRFPERQAQSDPGRSRHGHHLRRWPTGGRAGKCLPERCAGPEDSGPERCSDGFAGPSGRLGGFP